MDVDNQYFQEMYLYSRPSLFLPWSLCWKRKSEILPRILLLRSHWLWSGRKSCGLRSGKLQRLLVPGVGLLLPSLLYCQCIQWQSSYPGDNVRRLPQLCFRSISYDFLSLLTWNGQCSQRNHCLRIKKEHADRWTKGTYGEVRASLRKTGFSPLFYSISSFRQRSLL